MRDTSGLEPPRSHTARVGIALVLIGVLGATLFTLLAPDPLWDERVHREQIQWFVDGFFALQPWLPMPPTYHALIAAPAAVLGLDSLLAFRMISALVGLSSVAVFHVLARLRAERPVERTLHYLFLPLLFPFFFVLYTDATSLLFMLLTAVFLRRGRSAAAGLTGIIGVLVRQTNIFWLGFLFLWDVVNAKNDETYWEALKAGIRRNPIIVATAPTFLLAVLVNGGVTLDAPDLHPLGVYGGNVWFFFVAVFFTFAPLHLANLREVVALVRRPVVAAGMVLAFPVYWFTFTAPHIFNVSEFFLRNRLLGAVDESVALRIGLFALIAYTALSLSRIRLTERADYLVYVYALLALLPVVLVEVRYMLFPLVWIALARERSSDTAERWLLGYEVVVSVTALWLFSTELFY